MKYKFFGTPNLLVKSRYKKYFDGNIQFKPLFRFDENGEFITEDENLISKLTDRFDHIADFGKMVEETTEETKVEPKKIVKKRGAK
jgi:hypothetical protein